MKIKSNIFFDLLKENIELQLNGIEADINLFPCDPETLYAVDTFINDYDVHMIQGGADMFGSFKCSIIGSIVEERIETTICRISCDFEDALDLGKIITVINHALEQTVENFEGKE